MKKIKKMLALLLAAVMLLTSLSTVAFADGEQMHTVTVFYVRADNGDQVASPFTATITHGQQFTQTIPSPTVIGYEADQSVVTIDQVINADLSITVTYMPAVVSYSVEHYQQNISDDGYTLVETVPHSGRTGDFVSSDLEINYSGFYALPYDSEVRIAADGSTVIEIRYDRNYYLLTLDLQGGFGAEPVYARYGTPLSVTNPTKPGYTFTGWTPAVPATMPAEDTSHTAQWTDGSANYVVQYWQENANDTDYSFVESAQRTATTGTKVSGPNDKTYQGFTFDHADTDVTVSGDGTTVVNVYYKRNIYTVKFYSYSGWFTSSEEYEKLRITAKYGAYIGDNWPTYNGSNTWSTTDGGDTYQVNMKAMPLDGATFYGPKTDDGSESAYYYVEILPGETPDTTFNGVSYKLDHKDTSPGTGYRVTQEDKYAIEGFTYKEGTENGKSYNNAKFYYTRNIYDLVFNDNYGGTVSDQLPFEQSLSESEKYKNNYVPAYPATLEAGAYEFGGWYMDPGCTTQVDWENTKMPAANVVVYAKWVPIVHTVTFAKNEGGMPEYDETVNHGALAEEYNTTNDPYTFIGWFYKDDSGIEHAYHHTMPVKSDLNLYAKWRSDFYVNYIIHFVLQDDNSVKVAQDVTGRIPAGYTKTFEAKYGVQLDEGYKTGYYPTLASHSETMTEYSEGETYEYTFYYVHRESVNYTVRYLEVGTENVLHAPKTGSTTDAVVTETYEVITGYLPDAYQKTLILSSDDSENIITFWYSKDTVNQLVQVNHWVEKPNVEDVDNKDNYNLYSSYSTKVTIGSTYTADELNITGYTYYAEISNKSGTAIAGEVLVLNLYYTRNMYPYEFRFVNELTDEIIADSVTGNAKFQASVSQTAKNIDGYVLDTAKSPSIQTIIIQKEDGQDAVKNVKIFYYLPLFYVKHRHENIELDTTVEYTLTRDLHDNGGFDLTNKVPSGYLYGGSFNSDDCKVAQTYAEGQTPQSFTPVAGETYYIWEVPNAYLVPKSLSCWEHPMVNPTDYDIVDVIGFYLVTPVDREYYYEVGFDGTYKANSNADAVSTTVHFVANQDTEEFLDTDNYGTRVVITKRDNAVLYNEVRIGLKNGNTDRYNAAAFLSGGYTTGYIACYGMDKNTYWNSENNVGATIEYTPYWITLDGVKVSQKTRTCKYEGPGSTSEGVKHKMIGMTHETDASPVCTYVGTTANVTSLTLLSTYIADGGPIVYSEPEVNDVAITVHDNGNVYDVNVQPGDATGLVTYEGVDGKRFAGWYFDEALTVPADFTDIQEAVDVYAKYIDDAFFSVKYMERGFFTVNGISVVSAVDTDTYRDTGFVINGEVISCTEYSRYFGILSAQTLFGREVGRNAKLMSCTYSLKGMSNGDAIVITPYWVTPDGTTVYGETLNLTYHRYGLEG